MIVQIQFDDDDEQPASGPYGDAYVADLLTRALALGLPVDDPDVFIAMSVEELEGLVDLAVSDKPPVVVMYFSPEFGKC